LTDEEIHEIENKAKRLQREYYKNKLDELGEKQRLIRLKSTRI